MRDDIWQLTPELIEEYRHDGYEARHLEPGDWVWLDEDGELFVTAAELQQRICEREAALRDGEWPASWQQELEALRSALRRLQEAARRT